MAVGIKGSVSCGFGQTLVFFMVGGGILDGLGGELHGAVGIRDKLGELIQVGTSSHGLELIYGDGDGGGPK